MTTTEQRFRAALERITRMAYPVADGSEAERISAVAAAALDDAAPTGNADPPEPDCALCGHDGDDHGPGGACPE